jgi:hypothetical protein
MDGSPVAIVTALVDTAVGELAHALDAIPGETDPFKVDTAFANAASLLGNLKALVTALADPRFSSTLGASHAQAQE